MNTHDIVKIIFEILFVLTVIVGLLWKHLKDKKEPTIQTLKTQGNSISCKPGHGPTCVEHDRKIVKLEACMEYIQKELPEIKASIDSNRKETEKSFSKLYDLVRDIKP